MQPCSVRSLTLSSAALPRPLPLPLAAITLFGKERREGRAGIAL
jgi:hypothetical protein